MLDLIAAVGIGGIIGALVMRQRIRRERYLKEQWERLAKGASGRATARLRRLSDADAAHTRCADALATKTARIERALAVETPKAAHGVKKMAAILRGDL